MPTIGLVVEGEYDEAALSVLVKKLRPEAKVVTRKCRGTVTGRVNGIVAELGQMRGVDRIVVVADADGHDPATIFSEIEQKIPEECRAIAKPVVIVQMLEAWLISDRTALQKVTASAKSFPHPEKIRNPKAELRRMLSGAKGYTPAIARSIAEGVDLALLAQRCPSFRTFREAISGKLNR